MSLTIRQVAASDAIVCGRICYEAFKTIADHHNFLPDFINAEHGVRVISMLASQPGFYGVVAEIDGRIVGSNFLDERNTIRGIGPITVDPEAQNHGVGHRLMRAVIEHAERSHAPGIRLVQAAYHSRSLSLYTKIGFDSREPLSCMLGNPIGEAISGYRVRAAAEHDLDACSDLCARVHGHHRAGELNDAIRAGHATVVERAGRISGYASAIAFSGHAVGETNGDVQALVAAARAFEPPGFLVPTRNTELMRWCLDKGFKIQQPLTLMTIGLYNEPAGAWLPSIIY